MDQLYLNFHLKTEPSPQMDGCCFPQDGVDHRNGFPSYQLHVAQRELIQSSGEHMESAAWEADTTSLDPLCSPAVEYWPEQYQKLSFSEPAEAEVDQTENSSTASCCSMGEAGASPGSVGDCGYEYSSEPRNFAETGDMGFMVEEVATNAPTSVAPSIMLSEADSQDGLESLNTSEDSWLDSVEESSSSEQSVAKKYKGRTTFSAEQLRVLQQRFQLQRYVSASERQDLGNVLGLSSQQVKTWFQNRRMKVKRILKEPFDGPQIGFLQVDLSPNNAVVYRQPSDYTKQQFDNYSLPCLLPRQLVSTPSKQWTSPGPVYPSLGKFQSTLIKSKLQYTNQSVNFSIKKEAIALSRPELEPRKSPVTSYSHTIPVQHIEFSSFQRVLSQPGQLQQGPSQPGQLQQGPSQPGQLQQGPSQPGQLQQGPSQPGQLQQGPSQPGQLQQGPSQPGQLQQGPSRPGRLQQGPSRPGQLQQGPSRPGQLQQGPSRPGQLQQGLTRPGQLQHGPTRPGQLQHGPTRPGHLPQGPTRPGHLPQGPTRPGHLWQGRTRPGHPPQGPTCPGHLWQGPTRPGHLPQGPTCPGHLWQGPTRPGHLQQGLSFAYEMCKPAEDELQYEKVIIS